MRRQYTKSLHNDLEVSDISSAIKPIVPSLLVGLKRSSVPESMMGLPSPSHSNMGSFGPKTRTRSRCPSKVAFPGPGHYENRYAMITTARLSARSSLRHSSTNT